MSGSKVATAKKPRNSGLELLRILAIIGITAHHAVYSNAFDTSRNIPYSSSFNVDTEPLSIAKFAFGTILNPMGKVGVVAFFTITAWYLCEHDQTLKSCFQRVWHLEKEVFFWSVASFLVCFFAGWETMTGTPLSYKLVVRSFFPQLIGQWWYASAYAVFVLLVPFLNKGLRALGQRIHLQLCIVSVLLWGILAGFLPSVGLGMSDTFVVFLYLNSFITYWKWYKKPLSRKAGSALVLSGWLIFFVIFLIGALAFNYTEKFAIAQSYLLVRDWSLPFLLMGFGFFAIFEQTKFQSRIINFCAKSAFAMYLIPTYPEIRRFLWDRLFPVGDFYRSPWGFFIVLGLAIGVCVAALVLDVVRRGIFSVTLDQNKGRWFDALYDSELIRGVRTAIYTKLL